MCVMLKNDRLPRRAACFLSLKSEANKYHKSFDYILTTRTMHFYVKLCLILRAEKHEKTAQPCRFWLDYAVYVFGFHVHNRCRGFHPFARHCLAFALFYQLSSRFDSLIPSNSMELELCDCNYNLLNDPTWSASLRGVSGSVITIIHRFFISVNYYSDIFLNSSRFNSFLNSSSVGI